MRNERKSKGKVDQEILDNFAKTLGVKLGERNIGQIEEIYALNLILDSLIKEGQSLSDKIREMGSYYPQVTVDKKPLDGQITKIKKWYRNEICSLTDFILDAQRILKQL